MTTYNIVDTKLYHAGGGTWLTICEVEYCIPVDDMYEPSEIEEMKQSGEDLQDMRVTNWVVVGCGYLNVYDIEPFRSDREEQPEPIESFELDEFDPTYLMDTIPGLDLWDYCDDYWFCSVGPQGLVEHPNNLVYNVCTWRHKFDLHKSGHCL